MTDLSSIKAALQSAARQLLDGLLAELGSLGPQQHTRLLRLHTPLGPDVLLAEKAHITEHIGPQQASQATGYQIELLALSTRADLAPLDLIGQPVLLELLTGLSSTDLRPFHGHVTAMELLGSDGGYARYHLTIQPWTHFLTHRHDAYVFQNMSVVEITEAIFADYAAQGALQPQWRWELADRSVYAQRSLCIQFHESDWDFLQRLWAEEGLFAWFEHTGQPDDTNTLGSHTLILADHNGAFRANTQARVRFTQSGAALAEDSLTRWHGLRRVAPTEVHTASWDYRQVDNQSASAEADPAHAQPQTLRHIDQPGAYAYETVAQAERLATVQQQALSAQRKQFTGQGTVRTLSPGTTFFLADHPDHNGLSDDSQFVVLSVTHQARNNLSADAQAGLMHLLGPGVLPAGVKPASANATEEPVYQCELTAQRLSVPVRMLPILKKTVWGTQTAIVVGPLGTPIHTDRDGRILIQFHWQRGSQSSHRLAHPSEASGAATDNAPASDSLGTWVRVTQAWAGANWGGVFIPRVGQEVVVAFVEGDIDRPIVVGATYNGQGQANAGGNQVAQANAPAWFPGDVQAGDYEGHAHSATLAGIKTQSLDASQTGSGGYNQLVMDNTPGQGRVLAHTTQHQTWLQMGHLLQQSDNQRLAPRGLGLELHTQAHGAVRAASGLHLSAHARRGGTQGNQGKPTDTREAQSQLQSHAELVQALAGNAQTHLAKLPNEAAPDKLPVMRTLNDATGSLHSTAQQGDQNIPTLGRPDLVATAPGAITSHTPAHTVIRAGGQAAISTPTDVNLLSQRHTAWAVKDGISLFTRGEAKDAKHPAQDIGMKLHAASGNVNMQAQSGGITLTAEKAIDIQSTAANVTISAPSSLMLNGGGGYIKIDGADIEIGTSGLASFKASMKELAGGGSVPRSGMPMAVPADLPGRFSTQLDAADLVAGVDGRDSLGYKALMPDGSTIRGKTDSQGSTTRFTSSNAGPVKVLVGEGEWSVHIDADESINN
ncbi:MAG: type VI secretion system tip protein VgrG [Burkholderiales bacterium]|nr:type VI secretion system tip protein VgrG [Burkholderiales bacterium]